LYTKSEAKKAGNLKSSGAKFIHQAFKRCKDHQEKLKDCMAKMLLSIFFLGHIHREKLSPEDFLVSQTEDFLLTLQRWGLSSTAEPTNYKKVPDKTPFSILLDMAVIICNNPENEEDIKSFLLQFLKDLELPVKQRHEYSYWNYYTLEATVFAVCYNKPSGDERPVEKFYGSSLCCRGETEKDIMINRSCLKVWHEYVSYAVLSFRLHTGHEQRRGIRFPNTVICKAFYRNQNDSYEDRRPCKNCGDLFSLPNPETERNYFPYGNCAETECLSKLILNDENVMRNIEIVEDFKYKLQHLRESATREL
ncbi:hypothetical protein J4Q44_G00014700, partial [Coregonus suidteri]